MLLVEPDRREILPVWRFKTPEIAIESSSQIYFLFLEERSRAIFAGSGSVEQVLADGLYSIAPLR
ncbi:MAG: DUF4385 family protein [Microcoleus sp.]